MFAFNISAKRSKKILIPTAAIAALLAVVCAMAVIRTLDRPRDTATAERIGEYSLIVSGDNYDAFFRRLGIEADTKNAVKTSIMIPARFNEVYTAYNELQQRAGLDLSKYKGKEAQRITFPVKSGEADFAVLLVIKGRVIGGHLTSGEYGSEVLPLTEDYGTTG